MTETPLYNKIILALSHGNTRLFRTNSGRAWGGTPVFQDKRRLILSPYYAVKLWPPGSGDLIGWSEGCKFTSVEVKDKGRITDEQAAWIDLILSQGGRAGVARSVDDARRIITL